MPESPSLPRRTPTLLFALPLLLLSPATLVAADVVVLDGGSAWAEVTPTGLEALPGASGPMVLNAAVSLAPAGDGGADAFLAAGIEAVSADGRAAERLVLLRSADGTTERLPTPKQSHDAVTYAPTPLVDDGALVGLVWIEGFAPNRTRVMASDWTGGGWSQPVAVSDFGPGTQIGLDVVRLADGSRLAVWAAFDGEDDEIVWSRRVAGDGWSEPRALTRNDVPDVTPRLLAVPGGTGRALVAWSGYDGRDYRIQLSRFDAVASGADAAEEDADADGAWSAPEILTGETAGRGAVSPHFQALGDGQAVLTWHQAVPRTWMAAAFRDGVRLWTAPASPPDDGLPQQLRDRPLAALVGNGVGDGNGNGVGDGIELRWPGPSSPDGAVPTLLTPPTD